MCLIGGTVTLQGNDLGFKAGEERKVSLRVGGAAMGSPVPVAVEMSRKRSVEAWAGYLVGGRAALERGIVGRLAFEVGPGASTEVTREVSLVANAWARSEITAGLGGAVAVPGVVSTSGVGRKAAFTVPIQEAVAAARAVDATGGGLEALMGVHGDLDLADYRTEGYVARYGLNVAGTGGSLGLQALVTDCGDALALHGITGRRVQNAVSQAVEGWIAPQP